MKNQIKSTMIPLQTQTVSIGEVCEALKTIAKAADFMGSESMSKIITTELYASHKEAYIKTLELAGEYAKQIQQDAYMKANVNSIVACGGVLSQR